MLDWSDEGACADRNIWHACLILGCRSIVKAGVLYRKRMRHQGMQKVFCILTQGRLVEFAFPPLPLPPPPEQAALAERIAGHNPVMARMFGGRDSEVPAPSNASHPPPGGSEAHLIFSRLRTLALRQCYVVSRFSDDLSTEDMMCEPWVLTDIGNYSGLRLADRMYADGVVSHELITDCIFTVWRPASVSAALRADSDSMSRHIPADLSDAGDLSPGERMTGSGPDSKCSSPSLSVGGADCERATSPSMLSVRHQLAAGGYSAPSSPQAPAAAATAAASAASAQDRQNRHRRSTSQDIGGHISDAPHALGDGNASSVSNASSASSSRQRDTSRPGGDGRPGGQTQMYAAGMSTSTRKRVGVYRARTNAEMTQWVTAINQEIRRLSLAGEW
ncbi:hypothetical protein LPJ61_001963 [Coemansia biformis]|uniref:PH domain-containing protein n=1 Tax=Coemansia biformis TaxID=1286918 RepID=A0A9W8CZ41_9FUNG|nr:hypothetical protein LPJ61_001963 [Coemansia biformis]